MASTYSNYKIELIGTGDQAGTWGTTTNNNFQYAIEQAIGGYATQALTTTSTTLSLTDTNALQNARALFLQFTGTPGSGATVVLPSIQKLYFIKNSITTYDLIVKTSTATTITVPNGKTACIYVNGTDVIGTSDYLPSLTTTTITASGTATIGGDFSVGGTSTGSTYSTYTKTSTKITVNGTGFPFVAGDSVYVALTGGDAPSGVYTVDSSPTPTATAFTATPVFGSFPTGTTGGTVNSVTRYNNTTTIQTPLSSFGSSGTTGQVLVSQGAGVPPAWSTVTSVTGNWTVGGNFAVTGTSTFTGAATFNGNTTVGSTSTVSGTYGRSGTTVTITSTAHGFTTGQPMYLVFSAGTGGTATNGVYSITVVDANTFTITDSASGTITGSPAVVITRAGTYGRSTTTVTVTSNSHGFSNGQVLYLVFSAGTGGTATSGVYAISNVATNTFDVTDTASGTITGTPAVSITKYNNTATLQAPLSSFGSVGTSGYVLTSQGTGAPPQWTSRDTSTLVNGNTKLSVDSSGNFTSVVPSGSTLLPSFLPRAWVNFDGGTAANVSGTYTQSGTTVTVTITGHGLIAGNVIYADATTGTAVDGTYTVAGVTDANTFTYTAGTSLSTAGSITLFRRNIRGSGNVGSVTYANSAGRFYINFSTAMPDANYAATGMASRETPAFGSDLIISVAAAPTAGALAITCEDDGGTARNPAYGFVTVIR
jgi:hypothetical protein